MKCFESPLQPDEIMGVINTVKDKLPSGVQGMGLTVGGFLFLHALFMERGKYETTWTVLRKFGYTNELTLSDEILNAVPFNHAPDQVHPPCPRSSTPLRVVCRFCSCLREQLSF